MQKNRPPIIVILGHVDHGKTSLLDALRKTDIAASEVGGITQSTRAFQASGFTFIDTPGHAAFSAMRSRGGQMADMALLIVSGVDGVMPQTRESIATIKATGLPMIVAVTKKDLPEFNLEKIKTQLAEDSVMVEGFGGDVPVVTVSAKTAAGLPELLEIIGLVNEMNPAQSDPEAPPKGIVLESRMDTHRGPVAVVIIKNGTLRLGQNLFLDEQGYGKVKALTTTAGERVKEAASSMPVEILGLTKVAPVGEIISTISTPSKSPPTAQGAKRSFDLGGDTKGVLKVILKSDVAGSLEAIIASLDPLIQVVQSGTGDVNESDVMDAMTTGSVIVGFNVKVPATVVKLAENDKIKIYSFRIIYELLDKVHRLAHPELLEKVLGKAQIIAEFKIDEVRVAGCKALEGVLKKGDRIRLLRAEQAIAETKFKSLKIVKTESQEVKAPAEFGAVFVPYIDFKLQDTIIAYTINDG